MRIIDKGQVGSSTAYMIDTHPGNNIRVISSMGGVSTKETLPVNQWSHVAVTLGDGAIKVYLNGRPVAEAGNLRGGLTDVARLPLRLGADSSSRSVFIGLMDDVRLYRRLLTPEEITGILRAGDSGASPPPKQGN